MKNVISFQKDESYSPKAEDKNSQKDKDSPSTMHQNSNHKRSRSRHVNRAFSFEYNQNDNQHNNSNFKLKLSVEADNAADYENLALKHSRTFENKILNHEFKSIFNMLEPDDKSPDSKDYPKIRIGDNLIDTHLHPIEPENEDIQYQIEQINKELQEESDYQELENESSESDEDVHEEIKRDVVKPEIKQQSKKDEQIKPEFKEKRPAVITINSDDELVTDRENHKTETDNIQKKLSPQSYTNIQTEDKSGFDLKRNKNKSSKKKHRKKILFSEKIKNNHKLHKLKFFKKKGKKDESSFDRPQIVIKNQEHQEKIIARLEKGIVSKKSNSIYATGLGLLDKLIDDEKLMEFLKEQLSNEPDANIQEYYQMFMDRIKNEKKISFKRQLDERNNIKLKLQKSRDLAKKALDLKKQIRENSSTEIASKSMVSPAPYNPIKFTPKYRDNRPLGSATRSINGKQRAISKYMGNLTKDQILKFGDDEIQKYMRNLQDISSTDNSAYVYKSETEHILRKRSKQRLQTNPTKLAANLFSYYREPYRKHKNKHGSFALSKAKSNFFNDRNRSSILNTDAETKQTPNYLQEIAPSYNRILSAKPGIQMLREQQPSEARATSEYSTEIGKFSTAAHNPSNNFINQSLPSMPENMFQNFMHKQSQNLNGSADKPSKNKRKMDISLLSSNLNKKD